MSTTETTEQEIDVDMFDETNLHLCGHKFHDGASCRCIARQNQRYCHWHTTAVQRQARRVQYAKRRTKGAIRDLIIPMIEDPYSLQIAIHEVMDAIIDGRVKDRRAGHLLYALQLSQCNMTQKLQLDRHRWHEIELKWFLEAELEEKREAEKLRREKRLLKKQPQSVPAPAATTEATTA